MSRKRTGRVDRLRHISCPVCGLERLRVFFDFMDFPVHCNRLWKTREEAKRCPKGNIQLGYCPVCSFITNLAFDPAQIEYTESYESSLHFSPRFRDYIRSLAVDLIERYDLNGKRLLEIGCGKGDFLMMLCEIGDNHGVGIDPAYIQEKDRREMKGKVEFIKDLYSDRYIDNKADLIICRQTLEHIPDPRIFLTELARMLTTVEGHTAHVFFEVPNALHIFQNLSFWDIIYEHCSYFTPRSLLTIFSSSGFQIDELAEEFGGQYLCIHAQPNTDFPSCRNPEWSDEANKMVNTIAFFTTNYERKIKRSENKLKQMENQGERVVIWGAGSKGVSFLNTFRDQNLIEYAVDINPRKQGMYVPGTGQRIVSPNFLIDYQPSFIIVMNPIYHAEISELLGRLGINPELIFA